MLCHRYLIRLLSFLNIILGRCRMSVEDDYNIAKDLFDDKSLMEIKAMLGLKGINYKNIHSKMNNIGIKKNKSSLFTKEECVKLFLSLVRKDLEKDKLKRDK